MQEKGEREGNKCEIWERERGVPLQLEHEKENAISDVSDNYWSPLIERQRCLPPEDFLKLDMSPYV